MKATTHILALIDARTGLGLNQPGGRDRATWTRCPRCHAWTLTGLDNHVMALTARTDPTPLDRAGEATALLTGRATYQLHLTPKPHLRVRDHWQIRGQPPSRDTVVLPDHECGQQLAVSIDRITRPPEGAAHGRPPF